jgi:hypothetical protein
MPRIRHQNESMSATLPDEVMLFLYKDIILPWEMHLKDEVGCWDAKRTQLALKSTDVLLRCVASGQVEDAADTLQRSRQRNFVVFTSNKSKMKDLFRHLRNCAAHSSISTAGKRSRPTMYAFSGEQYKKTALAISGQLDLVCFRSVVGALATEAKVDK